MTLRSSKPSSCRRVRRGAFAALGEDVCGNTLRSQVNIANSFIRLRKCLDRNRAYGDARPRARRRLNPGAEGRENLLAWARRPRETLPRRPCRPGTGRLPTVPQGLLAE